MIANDTIVSKGKRTIPKHRLELGLDLIRLDVFSFSSSSSFLSDESGEEKGGGGGKRKRMDDVTNPGFGRLPPTVLAMLAII